MSDDVWGPWIEHDGSGFPSSLAGRILEVSAITADGGSQGQIGCAHDVGHHCYGAWDWRNFGKPCRAGGYRWSKIIRYRVRKPKGLELLEGILEGLPSKEFMGERA